MLVVGRLIIGPAQALFSPLALAMVAAQAPEAAKGRSLSLFIASSAIGRSLAFLAGGALLARVGTSAGAHDGWRVVSLMMTAPNLVIVLGLLLAKEDDLHPPPPRSQLREALAWLWRNRGPAFVVVGGSATAVLAVQTLGARGPPS